MSEWKVPTIRGTRWDTPIQKSTGSFLTWRKDDGNVFINIYCDGRREGAHPLFLIGALQAPNTALLKPHQRTPWAHGPEYRWEPFDHYYAGDGTIILLNQRRNLQMDGAAGGPRGKYFSAKREIETEQEEISLYGKDKDAVRYVHDFHCRKCGLRDSLSSHNWERRNRFATKSWIHGVREVSLRAWLKYTTQ